MKKLTTLFVVFFLVCTVNVFAQNSIGDADSLWEKRGQSFDQNTLIADAANINQAIDIYKKNIETTSGAEKEEATWKLIRAYYYKGKYTVQDSDIKKKIYDQGKELGEAAIKEFPESPGINFFLAVVWGVWGEEYGIFAAARKGVAGKMKKLCEKTIKLDPEFEDAGGYRVLGRLHFKAPKIPLILGWPSKKKAVQFLEKSLEIAPDDLNTKQFLAEALNSQKQKERANKLMKEILATEGMSEGVAEDANIKSEAKAILAEWEK
ncbi:hypothetical protein H8E88_33810 [candidate division KSB1 bacterium]|nr:hypothetical protein [candidate division KSB1 bacterium]